MDSFVKENAREAVLKKIEGLRKEVDNREKAEEEAEQKKRNVTRDHKVVVNLRQKKKQIVSSIHLEEKNELILLDNIRDKRAKCFRELFLLVFDLDAAHLKKLNVRERRETNKVLFEDFVCVGIKSSFAETGGFKTLPIRMDLDRLHKDLGKTYGITKEEFIDDMIFDTKYNEIRASVAEKYECKIYDVTQKINQEIKGLSHGI